MKLRKADEIEFEILKRLAISPTYGYNLYKFLQTKGTVSKKADVYKAIQKMKQKELISGEKDDSEEILAGNEKNILHITEKGKTAHYYEATTLFKRFEDMIGEFFLKELRRFFIKHLPIYTGNDKNFQKIIDKGNSGKKIKILIDFGFNILEWEHIPYLYLALEDYAEYLSVYIKQKNDFIIEVENNFKPDHIQNLLKNKNNRLIVREDKFDIIVSLRYNNITEFEDQMENYWSKSLSNYGIFVFGTFIEFYRKDPGFRRLFTANFTGIHRDLFIKEYKLNPHILSEKPEINYFPITDTQITQALEKRFKTLKIEEIASFFDIFIADDLIIE